MSASTSHLAPLPTAFTHTQPPPTLHYQGAEALLYRTQYLTSMPCALKHRPSKAYRHPTLDAKLTRHRILAEARALVKLRREGLRQVPAVYALDWENGWMVFEWVEGRTVREVLDGLLAGFLRSEEEKKDGGREEEEGKEQVGLWGLMGRVGRLVGKCHELGVIHGDLTTSNLMVRDEIGTAHQQPRQRRPQDNAIPALVNAAAEFTSSSASQPSPHRQSNLRTPSLDAWGEVILIDFGLAAQTTQDEDRAVDLYVLERAFGSTHPRTEELWKEVLRAYGESYKGAKVVVKKLQEVRMRGRKKIMIG